MSGRRWLQAWALFLAVAGMVGSTLGYALYYRSDLYRHRLEADLRAFFGLPLDVGGVEPHSFTARQLRDVQVWLPDRRARVFKAPRILWDGGDPQCPDGTVVHIYKPAWTIGSPEWESEDYMHILRASLRHDFHQLNVRKVILHDALLNWPHDGFHLTAEAVDGEVVFNADGGGHAELTARSLNGRPVTEPIRIWALLDPAAEDFLPEVTLTVPQIALTTLGVSELLGTAVASGSFAGRVTFRQSTQPNEVQFTGRLTDARLDELTARLPGGAIMATVDLDIHEAVVQGRTLTGIGFTGHVRDLSVDSLLQRWALPAVGGNVQLSVQLGRWRADTLERLSVTGQWEGASLNAVSVALLDEPGFHGQLSVRINALSIVDNEVVSGDIDVIARPGRGESATIETAAINRLLKRFAGSKLPEPVMAMLPERFEYVQIGAKLIIEGGRLRVLNARGPAGPALITASFRGWTIPITAPADLTFDLGQITADARERMSALGDKLRQRLRSPRPASAPTNRLGP